MQVYEEVIVLEDMCCLYYFRDMLVLYFFIFVSYNCRMYKLDYEEENLNNIYFSLGVS